MITDVVNHFDQSPDDENGGHYQDADEHVSTLFEATWNISMWIGQKKEVPQFLHKIECISEIPSKNEHSSNKTVLKTIKTGSNFDVSFVVCLPSRVQILFPLWCGGVPTPGGTW